MHVFNKKSELKTYILANKSKTLGIVPTMGALHLGHISLVKKAITENDITLVSIFVNPTQFNNSEDLKKYPNTLKNDIKLLKRIENNGNLIIFSPNVSEMYKDSLEAKTYDFNGLDNVMEGEFRENHFNGVATIVEKLLTLVPLKKAYFGEKDFQQLQIIKKLVKISNIPVEIIGCPIVRENNGLAMSSRNKRLSESLKEEASFIYKTLQIAKNKFGTESALYIMNWVENQFKNQKNLKLEYIQITDTETLKPLKGKQKNKKYRAFIAVYANDVRLIDNIALN